MDEVEGVILGHLKHAREQMDAARGLLTKAMQMDGTIHAQNTVVGLRGSSAWVAKIEANRTKSA